MYRRLQVRNKDEKIARHNLCGDADSSASSMDVLASHLSVVVSRLLGGSSLARRTDNLSAALCHKLGHILLAEISLAIAEDVDLHVL